MNSMVSVSLLFALASVLFHAGYSFGGDPDFSCVCIERTPKCNRYQVRYDQYRPYLRSGTENDQRWPDPGETVTYIGYVYNGGTTNGDCTCEWYTNGVLFSSAVVSVPAGTFASNSVSFPWPSGGEMVDGAVDITMQLKPSGAGDELSTTNNVITISTRDLTITFFMAQEYFDELSKKQNLWGTRNAVDWLRTQFKDMHDKFAQSVYPATPDGIIEQIRIDKFIVMPNASLGAAINSDPNLNKNDGRWAIWSGSAGHDAAEVASRAAGYANTFGHRIDYGLIHELAHQLGLIDIYQYDVEGPANIVTHDGVPALFERKAQQPGMMRTHGDLPFSEFSAIAMNSQVGRRRGYYGDFQFLIPRTNVLLILDNAGNPLANATIECFRRVGSYFKDDDLTVSGNTDVNGLFTLPNSGDTYATSNGYTLYQHPFGFLSVVGGNQLLVRITKGDARFYHWFDCIDANILYWRGNSSVATHAINAKLSGDPGVHPAISDVKCRQAGSTAILSWTPPTSNVVSYKIYCTGGQPYDAAFTLYSTVTAPSAAVTRSSACRYVCVAAVYGDGKESGVSSLCYLPEIPVYSTGGSTERYLAGVTALPDGNRLVCFHNSGEEEPSWQTADGNFAGKFSSVHNHLNALDAAYDKRLDRVIMTDLPDGYSSEHRIAVVDRLGRSVNLGKPNPSHMFGSFGSGPGQFNVPAGVAVDSQSRIYVADLNNDRIQAFTSQGDYITQFTGVSRPRGIEVDSTDRILVADTGNHRIVILGWNGTALEMTGVISNANLNSVVDVACGDNAELFTLNAGLNAVVCFTSDGTWITNVYKPTGGSGGTLFRPRGIACLPGNMLVVSDSGNNRVVEIDAGDVIPEPAGLLLLHVPAAFIARYYQQHK